VTQVAEAWDRLATDYERARQRPDSLDTLLEWPAQRDALGDVSGLRILDVGCGSGAKAVALAAAGATEVVGIDLAGAFVDHGRDDVHLVRGDLSALASVPAVAGRRFDRVLFFSSISYARDQTRTLLDARNLLADGGQVLVQRSHPVRFAVERSRANGTSLGEEYHSRQPYAYASGWNSEVTLTHSTETFSDMLNTFAAAGLAVDRAVEPQLDAEARERHPQKQAWLDQHLGVILFVLSVR
jgi:SAM-dependent methyltransferase